MPMRSMQKPTLASRRIGPLTAVRTDRAAISILKNLRRGCRADPMMLVPECPLRLGGGKSCAKERPKWLCTGIKTEARTGAM